VLRGITRLSSGRIIFGITALIVVYFLFIFAGSRFRAEQVNSQRSQLQQEISSMQSKYDSLQTLEQYLQSDEYVEKIAREQLGLVNPGETGIVVLPMQPSPTPIPGSEPPANWWDTISR
jgi:cell division protein DivIC